MASKNIISQREALDLLDDKTVSFLDCSWYLPAQNRDAKQEFKSLRIPGAIFFDIDVIADPESELPHMLPHPDIFAVAAGHLGLTHNKPIIVYDGLGMFSAPRVWWTLKVMGAENVRILEGGFDQWRKQDMPVEKGPPTQVTQTVFESHFASDKVAALALVEQNIEAQESIVLDARPSARFKGEVPEPRAGLRSGHIPKSRSLPASELVKNGTLLETEELNKIFDALKIDHQTPVITSCGSGVTAAIIALALDETGRHNTKLYDGSWAEWGMPNGPDISTNDE